MNKSCLTFIHTLSPLHAGTGQGVGVIDLPVAREKSTNLPFLPGSTLKGTLKDEGEGKLSKDDCEKIFGRGGDADGKSGSAIFSDQKLLCLPVRSLFGTFAWVTSPFVLERFKRDCAMTQAEINFDVPKITEIENCLIGGEVLKTQIDGKDFVILEDLDLKIENTDISKLAKDLSRAVFPRNEEWQDLFIQRFCVVSDDVMNFLAETATEITARNELKENKTSNNLWYEESLPTETILSGVLAMVGNRKEIDVVKEVKNLCEKPIQLGGNMTVGRGLCRIIIADGGEK